MIEAVVIGGGISGLTAARELIRKGRRVTLFEGDRLGGVILSSHPDGFTLEHGPAVLLEKPEIAELITELGLSQHVVYPSVEKYRQYVWFNGRPCEVPKGPGKFLRSSLLSPLQKLKTLKKLFTSGSLLPEAEDESVWTFLSRLIGTDGVQRIADPALRGIFGGDITKLSARSLFPEFWRLAQLGGKPISLAKRPKKKIFVLKGGIVTLVGGLERSLVGHVRHIKESVTSIKELSAGEFEVCGSRGSAVLASEVVVATSGAATAQYLGSLDPILADKLSQISFASLLVVHCKFGQSAKIPSDAFGILFPSNIDGKDGNVGQSSDRLLGVMFNSVLFPHVAPEDSKLVTVVFGGVGARELFSLSFDEISKMVSEALRDRVSLHHPAILNIHKWERAIPQYELGHYKIVEEMHRLEREKPGILFVGADFGGVGVPDRVKVAVERIRAFG